MRRVVSFLNRRRVSPYRRPKGDRQWASPRRTTTILYLVLLAALQLLRAGLLQLLFLWVPHTYATSDLASMLLFLR